ncbi:RNA polymerase sigma factor [Microbacterium sp. P07]|uniref:RNA polymerase sigma factor n=1 Tax=Microbacterium sp. P07 TaxID=3366952 RepID=UPI0037452972
MIKYFATFGRDRLPDDDEGEPAVPIAWLKTVIRNAAIDFDRQRKARPADPVDFQAADGLGLERLMGELAHQPSLSSDVAQKVDAQRTLGPALRLLATDYPLDLKLIKWRYIDDRDIETIAEILGKSTDAAKKAIQCATKRLRDRME